MAHEFAVEHLIISKEINDATGILTAQKNIADLNSTLQSISSASSASLTSGDLSEDLSGEAVEASRIMNRRKVELEKSTRAHRRTSMENLNLMKMTPKQNTLFHQLKSRSFKLTGQKLRPLFKIRKSTSVTANLSTDKHEKKPMNDEEKRPMTVTSHNGEDDRFFEQLSINQSRRFDDQTCLYDNNGEPIQRSKRNSGGNSDNRELNDLMDMLEGMQGSRMDDQRTDFPGLEEPSDQDTPNMLSMRSIGHESFVDMIIRCQSSRIEDQRSSLPESSSDELLSGAHGNDAFLQLIQRMQSDRIDEQRSSIAESF